VWKSVATSAVLLLVVSGCGSDDRSDPPSALPPGTSATTTAARLVGPPPTIPWWRHAVLPVNGRPLRPPLSRIAFGGGTTLVGKVSDQGSTWRRVVGDRLVRFLSLRQATMPRVSANGAHVAWVTSHDVHRYNRFTTRTAFTVTSYDVRHGRRAGSTTLVSRATCCDAGGVVGVLGVNNDGAVVVYRMGGPS
jgi:hypothetical protein